MKVFTPVNLWPQITKVRGNYVCYQRRHVFTKQFRRMDCIRRMDCKDLLVQIVHKAMTAAGSLDVYINSYWFLLSK